MNRDLMQLLTRSPLWAILPDRLAFLTAAAVKGEPFNAGWEASKPHTQGAGKSRMGVIPIQGVLTKDGPAYMGSNYDDIGNAAEGYAADASIKQIVLAVDSPGGEVTGLPEAAGRIAQAARVKPVSAVVEGVSASAAYWLTSQARDITIAPSAELGSVGVRMMHADMSAMLEKEGIKVTELYSGKFKTEWSPFKPLSEDAQIDMQGRLEAVHTEFLTAINNGRGSRVGADMRNSRMGEGRMFSAQQAYGKGLADRILAPHEAYRALMPRAEEPLPAGLPGYPRRASLDVLRARVDLERARKV